jgi:AcrR family transcriptional regulator
MSVSDITRLLPMGRWEPNARGRLARAALELTAARGYDAVTVAEIAAAAGVTERTFYRYFPDKADALFPESENLLEHLTAVTTEAADAGCPPLEAALAAVRRLAGAAFEEPERVRLSAQVIPTIPALTGRELLRQHQMARALTGALTASGVPALTAQLAGETALAVWRVALAEWISNPGARPLPDVVATVAGAARTQLRDAAGS